MVSRGSGIDIVSESFDNMSHKLTWMPHRCSIDASKLRITNGAAMRTIDAVGRAPHPWPGFWHVGRAPRSMPQEELLPGLLHLFPVSLAKDRSRAEAASPFECHLCMLLVSNTTCVLLRAFSFLIIWRIWTLTVLSHMFSS
jgi:hypothetical protein